MATVVGLLLAASASTVSAGHGPDPQGRLLISQTDGVLWSYDIEAEDVSEFATVDFGNFDIQFLTPRTLLIANITGSVSRLNLRTMVEEPVTEGDSLFSPLGVSVSRRHGGIYYIADLVQEDPTIGRVFAYHRRSQELDLLVTAEGGVESVAIGRRGLVYFTNGPRLARFNPREDPIQVEVVANIDDTYLNGLVVTPRGHVIVASSGSPVADVVGVFKVNVRTGRVTPIHVGEPLRNPEDVALAPNGDLYIIDSAFLQPPENFVPGLYRIARDTRDLETLHTGAPFGDVVDLLFTRLRR